MKPGRRIYLKMKNKKGILLFEVVMAVAILAIGLTLVSRSFTNCLRVLESARDYNLAILLADEVFLDLETKEPEEWPSEGDFKEYPRFNWTLETEEVEIEDFEDMELTEVELHINWERRNRNYKLVIPTYMTYEET